MMEGHIGIEIGDDHAEVVVQVHGDIDVATAPRFAATLDQVAADRRIVVDMAGVHFIDSTGLKVILAHYMRMREAGGSLRIRHPSAPVSRLLQLTSFDHLVEVDAHLEA